MIVIYLVVFRGRVFYYFWGIKSYGLWLIFIGVERKLDEVVRLVFWILVVNFYMKDEVRFVFLGIFVLDILSFLYVNR